MMNDQNVTSDQQTVNSEQQNKTAHRPLSTAHSEPFYQDELDVYEAVKKIVWKHLDSRYYKAFMFGSRATGKQKKWSDVDVGIEGVRPLDYGVWQEITDDFSESDLPYIVEVVDFKRVSPEFYRRASRNRVSL